MGRAGNALLLPAAVVVLGFTCGHRAKNRVLYPTEPTARDSRQPTARISTADCPPSKNAMPGAGLEPAQSRRT